MSWLSDRWDSVKDTVSDVWDDLKDGDILGAIGSFADAALNVFSLGLYDMAGDYIDDLFALPTPENNMSDRKQTVRTSVGHRSVIYGTARVGGQVVFMASDGEDDRFFHLIIVFAAHSCDRFETIYFNDEVAISRIGGQYVIADKFDGMLEYEFETGKQTGASPTIVSKTPSEWTLNHKLLGQTYAYFKLEYDRDIYGRLPNVTALIRGKDDIDLMDGSTGFTDNHGLCCRDYLMWSRGYKVPAARVDYASFLHARDVADEFVGFSGRRYTINGSFKLNTQPPKIMESMLRAGAASLTYAQGLWKITPGVYIEPEIDANYSESDLIGGVSFSPGASQSSRVNVVKGTFISPLHDYEETEFVHMAVPGYIERDGEPLELDIKLAFTNNGRMARRLGKIAIERSRYGLGVKVRLKHKAFNRRIGDRIKLSIESLGWVERVFRIEDIPKFGPMHGIDLVLREDHPDIYSWSLGEDLEVEVPPALSFPNPRFVSPPINLDVSEETYINEDGELRVRATFSYERASNSTIAYDVEVKAASAPSSAWLRIYSQWTDTVAIISNLPPGSYDFRVRGSNSIGAVSDWATITHAYAGMGGIAAQPPTSLGLTEIPNTPPSPRAQFSTIRVTITEPADPIFSHAKIQYQIAGDTAWVEANPTGANLTSDIVVLTDGSTYTVRAFSISTEGVVGLTPVIQGITISDIDDAGDIPTIAPLFAVEDLEVDGGGTSFAGKDAPIVWTDPNKESGYVREYQVQIYGPGSVLLHETTVKEPHYTYTFEQNANDYERVNGSAGANRSFQVRVKVIGNLQEGTRVHESPVTQVTISNPPPQLPSSLFLSAGYEIIVVRFTRPTDLDYIETRIWIGTTAGFTPNDATFVASVYDGETVIGGLEPGQEYFVKLAAYDPYGKSPDTVELSEFTAALSLGPWATVEQVDRDFIEEHLEEDSIDTQFIVKITAAKIVTGILAATETIGVGDPTTKPFSVYLGDKSYSGLGVALISFVDNATNIPMFAAFENGDLRLNKNAYVFNNGGFEFGNTAGQKITYDGATNQLTLTGKLVIASGSSGIGNFNDAGALATKDSVAYTDVSGTKPPINATYGAEWGSTLSGIPNRISNTATTGLNVTDTYFGYYDGTAFRSYIRSNGQFHFGSTSGNYIDFNGSVLTIDTENLTVEANGDVTFTGEITGSTITGSTFRTATSGRRVEMNSSTNSLDVYNSSNTLIVSTGQNITLNGTSQQPGLWASINDEPAVYGYSENHSGVIGSSTSLDGYSAGVRGVNVSGYGVLGVSAGGQAVRGESTNGIGVYGTTSTGIYDFYAGGQGTYGSFTGSHDALTDTDPEVGDILMATGSVEKNGLSNTMPYLLLAGNMSKAAYGVFNSKRPLSDDFKPAALGGLTTSEFNAIKETYEYTIVNSIGEGQINVCSSNGDLDVGDFICTSNTPGKGQRYDGQDMRYVVAKCIEPVVWANEPENVKQIACIYMCG